MSMISVTESSTALLLICMIITATTAQVQQQVQQHCTVPFWDLKHAEALLFRAPSHADTWMLSAFLQKRHLCNHRRMTADIHHHMCCLQRPIPSQACTARTKILPHDSLASCPVIAVFELICSRGVEAQTRLSLEKCQPELDSHPVSH